MPRVLTWQRAEDASARVFGAYVELLADSLGLLLSRIHASDPALVEPIESGLDGTSDDGFIRLLTAPETSFRLLWRGDVSDVARAEFIIASLEAEALRDGRAAPPSTEVWTALGDIGFSPEGTIRTWAVEGLMPLDFGSPRLRAVVIDEVGRPDGEWGNLSRRQVSAVRVKLRAAAHGIEATKSQVLDFVRQFNRVLVCFRDVAIPTGSSSGSTGQYVGRSFLTNPQLRGVDEVVVAEALVHEAIHGLLYMQERCKAWVPDALYMGASALVSPWSGNPLPLRQYLQACFVWYGLLHFWSLALEADSFPESRVRTRIAQALIGFLGGRLTDSLGSAHDAVDPEILGAIDEMQLHVQRTFTDVAPGALADITSLAAAER